MVWPEMAWAPSGQEPSRQFLSGRSPKSSVPGTPPAVPVSDMASEFSRMKALASRTTARNRAGSG